MIERATDANLLRRFAEEREEAAFAELVERHGGLVRRVCRRFLRSEHDVEDVFQATFLLLALRASDVAWRASIAGWVREVARRLALNARGEIARRRRVETPASNLAPSPDLSASTRFPDPACPVSAFTDEVERRDVRSVIDGEVGDLPEKYRAPLVLCYLEGKTNHEAAAQLGYPVGSMSRRLEKARGLLRSRLVGRGVTLGLLAGAAIAMGLIASSRRPGTAPPTPPSTPTARIAPAPRIGDDRDGLRELLAILERTEEDGVDPSRLGPAVRHAEDAVGDAPDGMRDAWLAFAGETRLAALDLADAGRGDASRLHAACVRCHDPVH